MAKSTTLICAVLLAVAIGLGLFLRPRPTAQDHLAAPASIPAMARQALRTKMARHGVQMRTLVSRVVMLDDDGVARAAGEIFDEPALARPVAGDELNGLLPARFFALQDELKARARRLVRRAPRDTIARRSPTSSGRSRRAASAATRSIYTGAADSGGPTMMLDEHYGRLLARTPTMPAAEQQALAERYAAAATGAMPNGWCLGNLRLVVKIARELGGGYRGDFMDLVQEGNAGLTHARGAFRSDTRHRSCRRTRRCGSARSSCAT